MLKIKDKIEKTVENAKEFIDTNSAEIVCALGFAGMVALGVAGTIFQNKLLAKAIVKEMNEDF